MTPTPPAARPTEPTERELRLLAAMIRVLRRTRNLDEAVTVLALTAKVVIERPLREVGLPQL